MDREFIIGQPEYDAAAFAVAFWTQMVHIARSVEQKGARGGSVPGKAPNIPRNFHEKPTYYMHKYFWPRDLLRNGTTSFGPQQPEHQFERRFRMPRPVFERLLSGIVQLDSYFRKGLRPDATGRMGISPLLKVICALRQISYDIPSDLADDLFDESETTASESLDHFCSAVNLCFGKKYLRELTEDDLIRIEKQFARLGFPGCIGSLDCAGWEWKNCPKDLQGVMRGKDGKPVLRMEVIADLDLWIWSFHFGLPGGFNDLNVLEVSNHFEKVLSGEFPSVQPSYTVDGNVISWYYYLTDGIYPKWKIFIQSIALPLSNKEKIVAKRQEAVRKCVEPLFGVLYRRYKSLFVSSQKMSAEKLHDIAMTAAIMHNMTVEVRRLEYTSDRGGGVSRLYDELNNTTDMVVESLDANDMEGNLDKAYVADDIKLRGYHRQLKNALINHIWEGQGDLTC